MVCIALISCSTKSSKSTQLSEVEQWETNIIGDWEWVLTEDSVLKEMDTLHMCYQVFYSIKADGTMKETEHRLIKIIFKKVGEMPGDKESILADDDDAIFTGTWRISNDTLYKEGILSKIQNGEYKQGQEIPRKETNVSGYSIIRRITKDSLFVAGKDGSTDLFIRK